MELKYPIVQLEKSVVNLTHKMSQAEDRILSVKHKKVYLSQIQKEHDKI